MGKKLIEYCAINAKRKFETAEFLFKAKRYDDCLFFCHLTLEFALKQKYVEIRKKPFPFTHSLIHLAELTSLPFTAIQTKILEAITTFNMSGRYDDFKSSFHKTADYEYTKKYFTETKKILLWLKNYTPKE